MHEGPRPDLTPAARVAVRGLAVMRVVGVGALAAGALVWWIVVGSDATADPVGATLAVLTAIALVAPGMLLLRFEWSLRRAALMFAELADRTAAGERFDATPALFRRSMRLAMRRRGIGLLATPWYWALAAWGFGASAVLLLAAVVLVVAALI